MNEDGANPLGRSKVGPGRVLLALVLYFSIAAGVTLPVLFSPSDHVIGDAEADVWKHLWGHDWVERSLLEDHALPINASSINHPVGGSLYPVDLLNDLLMIPLRHLFGHILAFNLLTWLHLVLGALSMFFLARRFMRSDLPALLAGFIYGFCPLVLTYGLASGVSNRLNLAWIPLFILLFLRVLEAGRLRDILGSGLIYFLTALGCWTYALLLYLFVFFFSVYVLLRPVMKRRANQDRSPAQLKRLYVDLLLRKMLPVAVVCGLAAAPLYLMASKSSTGSHALVKRYSPGVFWSGEDLLTDRRVPFRHAVLPLRQNLLVSDVKDRIYKSNYLGYSILFLAFFSLWSRRRFVRFFFPASLFFLLISQGPYLSFTHEMSTLPSPVYFLLVSVVPFMHTLNAIWQISLLTALCLAISAGVGLEILLARISAKRRPLLAWGSCLLVAAEQLLLSPVLMPVPNSPVQVPAFHRSLAMDQEAYAIFDYPQLRSSSGDLDQSEYFYYQVVHHKAIPYGIERPQSWLNMDPFWIQMKRFQQGIEIELDISPDLEAETTAFLIRAGFRYLIVHKRFITPRLLPPHLAKFEEMFGPPIHEDEDVVVFGIEQDTTQRAGTDVDAPPGKGGSE